MAKITCTTMTPNHCSLEIENKNYDLIEFYYNNDSDRLDISASRGDNGTDINMSINQEDLKHLIQFLQSAVKKDW